ncbi:MAG: pyridoxal-dependent decarboxylase, exosortase A system-associated [Burkholderiales bacterium]
MSGPLPQHAPLEQFAVENDCLVIGGVNVIDLAARVGQTPFYAYDRQVIDRRITALRAAMPPAVKLHYAMKANPMPAVVSHIARRVDGIDVASGRELRVALDAGTDPYEISFAGPAKSQAELEQAVASRILVNIESRREIELLTAIGRAMNVRPRVAVRVNPDFELKSAGMRMGGGPKQFGIDAEEVPAVLKEIGARNLGFEGFHIFWGSQSLRADAICDAQQKSFELAVLLAKEAPRPVRVLNIGGGLGIPYFPGEQPLDLKPIGENVQTLVGRAEKELPNASLVIELGRYLVGEAGVYICKVIDRKISRGQVFLVTDGGLHHHLAASGNFGQVIRKNYPVAIANKMRGAKREVASVVGPLCTPLDLLADRMELAEAEPGDLVAVFQSGAYGLTASPSGFLSHPAAVEVVV